MRQQQKGFTLVEIAIVLVIIGLLLGGILKGQELINSARVRNLADSTSGIQAAYFGFIDRYRRVPGDWDKTTANASIGGTINSGGNNNGRLDNTASFVEPNALWEHLSKAGFINGSYTGATAEPTTANGGGPFNPFNSAIVMARTADYIDDAVAVPPVRLHLIVGRGTPVDMARELDTKLDDSSPGTGGLRSALNTGATLAGTSLWGGAGTSQCTLPAGPGPHAAPGSAWDVNFDAQDCNAVFLF